MNNLCDLYLAHQGKRNIFQEVKEFQKQESQSRNFQTIMEWLRNTVELRSITHKNEVTSVWQTEIENNAVEIKARTRHLECYIYEWEWQEEREICVIPWFYALQKEWVNKMELINTLRESQRLRSGGRRVLRKYGISNDAQITQPIADMDPGKAARLALNWLTLNAKNRYDVELRIKVPEERMVYRSRYPCDVEPHSFNTHEKRRN